MAGGGGDIVVAADTVSTTGDNSVGILASTTAGGTVNVDAGTVTTSGFAARGIEALAFGDVNVAFDSVTTNNLFATGVQAYSNTGDVSVIGGALTTNSAVVTGIDASTDGPGNVLVDVDTVTTTGTGSAAGIVASSTSGDVTVNADTVSTLGDSLFGGTSVGILTASDTGAVLINAGRVTAAGVGTGAIQASTTGAGPITINTSGVISSAQGTAILLNSGGTAQVNVAAGSSVNGSIAGIDSTAIGGATIVNAGTIGSTGGFAINASGGAATIRNTGVVNGRLDLTNNADTFANNAGGVFNASGTSDFGAGADSFTNAGVLTAFSSATFNGLETFSNTGLIDLRDGAAGDVLTLTGTAFNGGAGSQVGLDVNLATGTADRLVIGAASGVTSLLLADAAPGAAPNLNLTGILLVDAASATAGNFVLGGQTDFGFNRLNLVFDTPTANFLLVTTPDTETFEIGRVGVAVSNAWNQSADAWSARMTELRDVAGSGAQPRSDGFEMWAQGYGGTEGQDQVRGFTLGGVTTSNDLSYDQDFFGFQFGGDIQRTMGSATVLFGLTGGVGQSDMELASGNHIDLQGGNLGAYAAVNVGGFFANGLVKADRFSVTVNALTAAFRDEVDGTSYGAKGEVGYHFDAGSFFVEPVATLAYSDADIDDLTVPGGVFTFDDLKSLRGEAGVRMGGTFGSAGGMRYQPFIGVFAVKEFEGNGLTTFTSGTTVFGNEEIEPDTYGKVSLGLNLLDQDG
ncbi:MAG: autotransporter outer membrane beta-barrel domain-containing protein, partial [Caulobacteraceae bacterium]